MTKHQEGYRKNNYTILYKLVIFVCFSISLIIISVTIQSLQEDAEQQARYNTLSNINVSLMNYIANNKTPIYPTVEQLSHLTQPQGDISRNDGSIYYPINGKLVQFHTYNNINCSGNPNYDSSDFVACIK